MFSFPKKQGPSRHSLVYDISEKMVKPVVTSPAPAPTTQPVPPYKKPVPMPSPVVKQVDPVIIKSVIVPEPVIIRSVIVPEPVIIKPAIVPKPSVFTNRFLLRFLSRIKMRQ